MKKVEPDIAGFSFGFRGVGKPRKKFVGKWYKPWTWRKYVYVIETVDLVSIDFISPPNIVKEAVNYNAGVSSFGDC